MSKEKSVPGSFRDPSGYVYILDGIINRSVNKCYQDDYEHLIKSGLYEKLVKEKYLVEHKETEAIVGTHISTYKNLIPDNIPFISYPYEWSFSQLKDAALLTLDIQIEALNHDMTLKDASAYNIQYKDRSPIFIDTLSFEKLQEGKPWVAYQQFCQHFLAPLALMSRKDIRWGQLLKIFIDGIPLDLASKLLPIKSYLSFGILSHIHLHAKAQTHYSNNKNNNKIRKLTKTDIVNICESLKSIVSKLDWQPENTEWNDYYACNNNYATDSMHQKEKFVSESITRISPDLVWDLGANTGHFSRLSSLNGYRTISFDIDPACVEINYLNIKEKREENLLPLLLDLTNPSPAIGWANTERPSVYERATPDLIMALALIHHLAISNNLPLIKIAELFSKLAPFLIIEFVPKSDSMVKRLLSTRKDIFFEYNKDSFETVFSKFYKIVSSDYIVNSERSIYFMERI